MRKVSIIIPAYNEENYIDNCLKSLKNQSIKNIEIIVVDDGSIDKTREIAKKFRNVRLIEGRHRGPGFSRNLGAKKAKGKILIFVDADMTFDKDYIKNLINPMIKDKNIIGTTHSNEIAINTDNIWSLLWGKVRVNFNKNSKERYSEDFKIFRAIRKNIFLKFNGFNPKYGYADDQTFWIEHKMLPFIALGTICYHRNAESLKEIYKQSRWIGASMDNKLTQNRRIKYFVPPTMVLINPIAIILLSLQRCYKNRNFRFLIPWMLAFMTVRYFGTIAGLSRKIYLNKNIR